MGEEEKVHCTNEGFVYYWYKQLKHSPSLGLRINTHQPQSGAGGYYSCYSDLCGCQYSCQFFWTAIDGELTNKCNFTLKEPPCAIEELQDEALHPFNRTVSIQRISLDSAATVFFNSRQLHVFTFISSIMFTTPIRTFCNLV